MPVDKLDTALATCKAHGIRNIVALRGDPPAGSDQWEASEGGFSCALDLVRYIRAQHGDYFGIAVAGYPEPAVGVGTAAAELIVAAIAACNAALPLLTPSSSRCSTHMLHSNTPQGHPDRIKVREGGVEALSASELTRYSVSAKGEVQVCGDQDWQEELTYLKEKCDAGADVVITQMFFDPEVYGHFVKDCRAAGITAHVIPGIMCINAFGGFQVSPARTVLLALYHSVQVWPLIAAARMTGFCKTRVPPELLTRLEAVKDNETACKELGVQYGEEMCRSLQKQGAVCLHFYTLNLEKVTVGILRRLGLATSYDAAAEAAAIAPPATENAAQMLDMIKSGEVLKAGAADTNGAAAGVCARCTSILAASRCCLHAVTQCIYSV
eukprot:5179-Heterococcus_DN1.PRE.1